MRKALITLTQSCLHNSNAYTATWGIWLSGFICVKLLLSWSLSLSGACFYTFKSTCLFIWIHGIWINLVHWQDLRAQFKVASRLKLKLLSRPPPLPPPSQVLCAIVCVYRCVWVSVHNCILYKLKTGLSFTSGPTWCSHDSVSVFLLTLLLRNRRNLRDGFELPQPVELAKRNWTSYC